MKQLPFLKRPYFARRVLDVGSGHNPFKGVTHVLDRDVEEGRERGGHKLVVPPSAKQVVGQAIALPFEDGSFEYVYASHVLEHVHSPDAACRELMRVGAAGYVETPSPFLEQGLALHNNESPENGWHKWFVFPAGRNQLVFEPKTTEEVSRFCSCADGRFMQEFYAGVDFRDAQHCFRRNAKTTMFYWKQSFHIEVRDHTTDCRTDQRCCRFVGMKRMLVANCNDVWRVRRVLRLRKLFPGCGDLFRKYGNRTLFIH